MLVWYGGSSAVDEKKVPAESHKDCAEHHKPTAPCPGHHIYLLLPAENVSGYECNHESLMGNVSDMPVSEASVKT